VFRCDYPPEPHEIAGSILDVYKNDMTSDIYWKNWHGTNFEDYEELYEGILSLSSI
jgi:hypothetical protein